MKFLTFALEYENSQEIYEGYEAKPFAEFLKDKYRIDGKLLRAVLYSIALNGVADEDGKYGGCVSLVLLLGGEWV